MFESVAMAASDQAEQHGAPAYLALWGCEEAVVAVREGIGALVTRLVVGSCRVGCVCFFHQWVGSWLWLAHCSFRLKLMNIHRTKAARLLPACPTKGAYPLRCDPCSLAWRSVAVVVRPTARKEQFMPLAWRT